MARSRTALAVLGGVAAVLGVLTVAAPGLADALAIPRIPVAAVGGLAGLFALFVGLRRRGTRVAAAAPPLVEDAVAHPVPGADHDAVLLGADRRSVSAARSRRESRERLHAVAVETLVAAEGWTDEAAEAALRDGTWTDDQMAAACFSDDPAEPTLRNVLGRYLDGRSQYQLTVDHAVHALQARLEGEDRP